MIPSVCSNITLYFRIQRKSENQAPSVNSFKGTHSMNESFHKGNITRSYVTAVFINVTMTLIFNSCSRSTMEVTSIKVALLFITIQVNGVTIIE